LGLKKLTQTKPEGAYTTYLFVKGIDKILKKVGEESAEVIIAAKNSDPEEIKCEVSDLFYHTLVMLEERGIEVKEVARGYLSCQLMLLQSSLNQEHLYMVYKMLIK